MSAWEVFIFHFFFSILENKSGMTVQDILFFACKKWRKKVEYKNENCQNVLFKDCEQEQMATQRLSVNKS